MRDALTPGTLEISETGLKLIKAFEGYRPVDRELVSGQRVVGYGHRLYSDDAVQMTKLEAQETLLADLAPFQDMINTEVHAPLSQGQYDALCSFAFNIGPKAFLESDTLRALNNGRPLDAANGLDIWRKSEIAGKTYVVDALMRRRTAEKALFLRTKRDLSAGRADLPPVADTAVAALSTEDALPIFRQDDANGIVATAPYEATEAQFRRRDDGPAGVLELSERDAVFDVEDVVSIDEKLQRLDALDAEMVDTVVEADLDRETNQESPIAEAATNIVARLEALIEDADAELGPDEGPDFPESLIQTDANTDNVVDLYEGSAIREDAGLQAAVIEETDLPKSTPKPVAVIDELAQDDAMRRGRQDSAAKYILNTSPEDRARESLELETPKPSGGAGLFIPVVLGFILLGASLAALLRGAEALMGQWGELLAFVGLVLGTAMILAGIYAALRLSLRNLETEIG
jgi:GH24 family phage-related lysozyme (muramidase)